MGHESRVRIGTSGWVYKDWKGLVYPAALPARRWLTHYAGLFDTVEINNSFYRMPSDVAFANWARQATAGFLFAIKASRYITHTTKLSEPESALKLFLEHARALGKHLGPILYQLPPGFHIHVGRLRHFLSLLPTDLSHVIEFRDASWYVDEVRSALTETGVGFCIHDMRGVQTPQWVTGRTVYVRFHGPTARAYTGRYTLEQLRPWAGRMEDWQRAGHSVYAYFNNTDAGHAATNASELKTLLDGKDHQGAAKPVEAGRLKPTVRQSCLWDEA